MMLVKIPVMESPSTPNDAVTCPICKGTGKMTVLKSGPMPECQLCKGTGKYTP